MWSLANFENEYIHYYTVQVQANQVELLDKLWHVINIHEPSFLC